MFKFFKKTDDVTWVKDINERLTREYDLKSAYEIRLATKNGYKKRDYNANLKMPPVSNTATLGIRTVAELCEKIGNKFGAGHEVRVKVWDGHNKKYVAGNTKFETIRN